MCIYKQNRPNLVKLIKLFLTQDDCSFSLPTDACIEVSNTNCTIPQDLICVPVESSDQCLVTLSRAFEPGSYCVNITLSDTASLALASTIVSIDAGK